MAEELITSVELADYMNTLNKDDPTVRRVLASIQTLHPSLLTDLVNFLVNGVISINYFEGKEVNNSTVEVVIRDAHLNGSGLVSRVDFYRNKVRALPTYVEFLAETHATAPYRLSRQQIPKVELVTYFSIDPLGLIPNSRPSLREALETYNAILDSNIATELRNDMNTQAVIVGATIPNFLILNEIVNNSVRNKNIFLQTHRRELVSALTTDCIVGNITRRLFLDFKFRIFMDNREFILNSMALDYDLDTTKTGKYTIRRLIDDPTNSWNSKLPSNSTSYDSRSVLDRLSEVVYLRQFMFTELYGSAMFSPSEVNAEKAIYESMMDYFEKSYLYCIYVSKTCKEVFNGENN